MEEEVTIDIPKETTLPILYIKDAVDFLVSLWKAKHPKKRIYIVGGVPVSIKDLIETLQSHVPKLKVNVRVDKDAERVARAWTVLTQMMIKMGMDKLYRKIEDLGWELKYSSVEKIVGDFVADVRSNKELYTGY